VNRLQILIVKMGSIGDIVHTLPALAALRRCFPEARIDWLVESRSKSILQDSPSIDELIEVDTLAWRRRLLAGSTWREITEGLKRLRARRYDFILDFQGLLKSGTLAFLARGGRRIGFARGHRRESLAGLFLSERIAPPPTERHVIDRNLFLLRALGIESRERVFPIAVPEELDRRAADQLARWRFADYVALNPGGGWESKRWGATAFGRLAELIAGELGLPSLVLWGPGEDRLAEETVGASGGWARLAPPTGVREMIPYLKRARLFVGGDTGPLHIASALAVPVVGIYGPTDPARTGPVGPSDAVVSRTVPCGPCHKRRCPGFGKVCLVSIAPEEVLEAVRARLNERAVVGGPGAWTARGEG
jgi:lipopolysaccharide heptosyltransferase I